MKTFVPPNPVIRLIAWIALTSGVLMLTAPLGADQETLAPCRAAKFPYGRTQSRDGFQRLFDRIPRRNLVQYFFSEVTKPRNPSVAKPLSVYLIGTEANTDLREFFELVTYSADVAWDSEPRALPMQEVCDIFHRVVGPAGARVPASTGRRAKAPKSYPVYLTKP